MTGRRVRAPEGSHVSDALEKPGDYGFAEDGALWVILPHGENVRLPPKSAGGWGIQEHEDGTVTVTPSIFCHSEPPWHGFLEHGVWREV